MSSSKQNSQGYNPFGKLISLLALVAAALYFTGWVYRWAYFGFFQIEVITLNLPIESFYLAAFRSLIGNPLIFLRTIITFTISSILIILSLQLVNRSQYAIDNFLRKFKQYSSLKKLDSLNFLLSLIDELIIFIWVLITLFSVASWQGDLDSSRDAVNETSRLPVVTTIIRNENAAIGRNLNDIFDNPSGFRVIGNHVLYERLLGTELTDLRDQESPRVWRLLIDRDGYYYIFPALPNKDMKQSFPVLIIYENSNNVQLTIISSEAAKN